MVSFEPLIRCRAPGCEALVEPSRAVCGACDRSNFARDPGRVKPHRAAEGHPAPSVGGGASAPDSSPPKTPPAPEKSKPSPQQEDKCCGPLGFYDCPDGASVDRRHAKRCPRCAAAAKQAQQEKAKGGR